MHTSFSSIESGRRRQYTATSSLRLPLFPFVTLSLSSSEAVEILSSEVLCLASRLGVAPYIPGVGGASLLAGVVPLLLFEIQF